MHTQLLTSVPSAPRSALQAEALQIARSYEREARQRIQHMNIAAADLDIRHGKNPGPFDELMELSSHRTR